MSEEREALIEDAVEALLFKPGFTADQELWRGGLLRQEPVRDAPECFRARYYLLLLPAAPSKRLTLSMLNAVLGYDCDGYKIPYASALQVDRYADRYYRQCLLGLCRALSQDGPGRKVLAAVKGHANCELLRAGLNRLFKNYMRPYKAKMPGPSYYRIPFHRELGVFLLLLTLHNPGLLEELCTESSFLLPQYLATRLVHPDDSE